MYLQVLGQCGRRYAALDKRQCLQICSVGSFSLIGNSYNRENQPVDCNLYPHKRQNFLKQQLKYCSSSHRENPANQSNFNLNNMKHKLNRYANVIGKEHGLTFTIMTSNLAVASKELIRTIRDDVADLKSCPLPPLVLGFGGLIPFVAAPAHFIMSATFAPGVAYGQLAYGAVILSFIGGIRWGVSLDEPKWDSLVRSVIPSLIGWSSLLVPHWLGCIFVGAGLISMAATDKKHPKYQPWFRSLRVALTTIAVISIGSSLFFSMVLPVAKN